MPLYEYQCDSCGHRFERIQKFSDPPVEKCPLCEGPVHKLLSSPAFQFKGSGWYATDYAKKTESSKASEGTTGDKASAGGDKTGKAEAAEKKDAGAAAAKDTKPATTKTS